MNSTLHDLFADIYETRDGAAAITMPQFFCFYRKITGSEEVKKFAERRKNENSMVTPPFYQGMLEKYVGCGAEEFVLKKEKESFWRTFHQSEMNGESFYFQQIITKRSIFQTTFEKDRGDYHSWKG